MGGVNEPGAGVPGLGVFGLLARHCRPVRAPRGAVAAGHPLAAAAGAATLAAGGGAADAAIAAAAVICVAMPQAAGIGGDLLALVHDPAAGALAIEGSGTTPAAATAVASSGGASVTVPGLVGAWGELHGRWGRLPLAAALEPAIELARTGLVVDDDLARAVAAQHPRLVAGGGASWPLLDTAAGERWAQPELAALLGAIGDRGPAAFYSGPAADAVAAAVTAHGGSLVAADLARHTTGVLAPLAVPWAGGTVLVQPPMSQGILLAMALRHLEAAGGAPDDHHLVELTEAAFAHRSRCGEGAALLDEPLEVDPRRAARRGGPRAYLHTAGVAAADDSGLVVAALVSVFDDFGSGVVVPELGIVLNNRAGGFTDGANAHGPGRRPVHTLAPFLALGADGSVTGLATPGADGQVQTLLQVLVGMRHRGRGLAAAIAAPRWRSEGGRLLVEGGHPAAAELGHAGHDVEPRPAGDDVFGAVVAAGTDAGGPYAAADWRRATWASGA